MEQKDRRRANSVSFSLRWHVHLLLPSDTGTLDQSGQLGSKFICTDCVVYQEQFFFTQHFRFCLAFLVKFFIYRKVVALQKSFKDSMEISDTNFTQFLFMLTPYMTVACLSKLGNPLWHIIINCIYRLYEDFPSFSNNEIFFLFQDPIQDTTLHLVVMPPSLPSTMTISQNFFAFSDLDSQIFFRISLNLDLSDAF